MCTSIGDTPSYFKSLLFKKGSGLCPLFVFVIHPRYYHTCTCDLKIVLLSNFPIMPYAHQEAYETQ